MHKNMPLDIIYNCEKLVAMYMSTTVVNNSKASQKNVMQPLKW